MWLTLIRVRAGFLPTARAIGIFRFDASSSLDPALRGVIRHELVHALVRSGRLPVDVLDALARHSDTLGVLDMGVNDFVRALGYRAPPRPGASLRDTYANDI